MGALILYVLAHLMPGFWQADVNIVKCRVTAKLSKVTKLIFVQEARFLLNVSSHNGNVSCHTPQTSYFGAFWICVAFDEIR